MIKEQNPTDIRARMKHKETFVLNVVSTWCPDCVERQQPNFPEFVQKMEESGIPVYQCCMQVERLIFVSPEHESLTDDFGGHGYPRTVLILNGNMVDSRVEVMEPLALSMMADSFVKRVHSA
jgi:hypothetical protein